MGGKSSSSSSSSTTTNTITPQINESDDALVLAGDFTGATVTQTDGGAVYDALTFAGGGMSAVLDESAAAREDSLTFGAGAFKEAMAATEKAQQQAIAAAKASAEASSKAYSSALSSIKQSNADAYSFAGGAQTNAYSFAGGAQNNAFEFVGGAFDRVLDEVRITSASAAQTVASSAAHVNELAMESLNRVESANRSDSSKFMEMSLLAGAVVAALAIWRNT